MSKDRRRVPRFIIPPGQFWVQPLDLIMATADVSLGGLALRAIDRKALESFSVGQELSGEIRALGNKFKAKIKVIHIRGLTLGCEWLAPSEELTSFLGLHFSPKALGASLKTFELPQESLMNWWHAPLGADLIFYRHTDNPAPYLWALFLHGSVIQWDLETGLRTGRTVAEDEEGGSSHMVRLESRMLEFDPTPDLTLIQAAKELVSNANQLPADLLNLVKASF